MKFFRFASSTPPPPPPPSRPPAPPLLRSSILKRPALPRATSAPPPAPGIVGNWQEPGSSDMTEFRSDGTLIERLGSGETINGRYSLDGLKLRVKLENVDELSFSVMLTRDRLALTDPNGQVAEYRRV